MLTTQSARRIALGCTLHASEMHDSVTSPRPVPGFITAVLIAALIAFSVVAIPVFLLRPQASQTVRPPEVKVLPGAVGTVPATTLSARRALVGDVAGFLKTLYERAFLPPSGVASSPTPAPASRIEAMFTPRARDALRRQRDVFAPGDDVVVAGGRVRFDGVITLDGDRTVQALIRVDFAASGSARQTPVALAQKGDLLVVQTPAGWQIAGFNLKLNAVSVPPTPSPTR